MLATKPTINFEHRPDTQDRECFQDVMAKNCYRLPESFAKTDRIIDGGAHIGSFTVACLARGAGHVWSYEPDPSNFGLLNTNTFGMIGRHLKNAALWRNDKAEPVRFSGYPGWATACGTILPGCTVDGQNSEIPVSAVSLDDAILEATERGKYQLRLLKLDIEGAEFVTLGTSKCLHLVDEIVGEIHEIEPLPLLCKIQRFSEYTRNALAEYLNDQGFNVALELNPTTPRLSLFFARR